MPNDPAHRSLRLIELSHKPQDILNEVTGFTWPPNYTQEDHKREFVRCYKDWKGMETPNDAEDFQELQRDLRSAMRALDGFFFNEVLSAYRRVRINEFFKELKLEGNIFSKGHDGHDAFLRTQNRTFPLGICESRNGQTTIYIDALQYGVPRSIESIFETLVHEMAHAIFQSFANQRCVYCNTSDPAVLGTRGHGLVWVQMAEHMRDTIQSWDDSLAKFYNTDDIRWHNRERN